MTWFNHPLWLNNAPLCMYFPHFLYSSVLGHLGWFHNLGYCEQSCYSKCPFFSEVSHILTASLMSICNIVSKETEALRYNMVCLGIPTQYYSAIFPYESFVWFWFGFCFVFPHLGVSFYLSAPAFSLSIMIFISLSQVCHFFLSRN
jgi:hypothetical protein